MVEQKVPQFTEMRFLKNEILRNLRDFPRDVVNILTANYSDGVIAGLDLTVTDEVIRISPGIVKNQERLLLLGERMEIPYQENGKKQILKLVFEEPYKEADFSGQKAGISLSDNIEPQKAEMELARFQLEKGAYLRSEYQDLLDFSTGYNTLNLVYQPYSSIGETTIHPRILQYFARELLSYRIENPQDTTICFQILNQSYSISKEVLGAYFQMRLQEEVTVTDNVGIHEKLVQILEKAKREKRQVLKSHTGNRKLIVD